VAGRREQEFRRHEIEAVRELGWGETPVLARDDRTEPRRGEEGLEVLDSVLRKDRDPIALPDAALGERTGERSGTTRELAVRVAHGLRRRRRARSGCTLAASFEE
jgi:hypothetical protein